MIFSADEEKTTRWLKTRKIKHCPGNGHTLWICEAGNIKVLHCTHTVIPWIRISETQIQSQCSPRGTCRWPNSTAAGLSQSTTVSLANFNTKFPQNHLSSQVGTICPSGRKTSRYAALPNKQSAQTIIRYEGRTESHEQLFFFMRTGNSTRRRVRW